MTEKQKLLQTLEEAFQQNFHMTPQVIAYAPGRVEILGNHTDYNDGFVLSAGINHGTFFLASPRQDRTVKLIALDAGGEICEFNLNNGTAAGEPTWANYIKGVASQLRDLAEEAASGFNALFSGDLPQGAGLSSSAALELSAGLAIASLWKVELSRRSMAKIGQKAEHHWVGVKCGLLDHITSLFAKKDSLVFTDFRSLEVEAIPYTSGTSGEYALLICNTKVKHSLVDSEYNERRESCETAASHFKQLLAPNSDRQLTHLRDVSWVEWTTHSPQLPLNPAKRAAHVIGENERVLKGKTSLEAGDLASFGQLLFESHNSSQKFFENSCPELDIFVQCAKERASEGVLGARLSGGGFGGSVVVLVKNEVAEKLKEELANDYLSKTGKPCTVDVVTVSDGATILKGKNPLLHD